MSENHPVSELPRISREQVVYKMRNVRHLCDGDPAGLPSDNPQVAEANALHELWQVQVEEGPDQSLKARLERNLSKSTVYVDAGYDDPDYLREVANDWLLQDLDSARTLGLITSAILRIRIQVRRWKINKSV